MSQGFLNLKRDIVDFQGRLEQWIKEEGAELDKQAAQLKLDIEDLQSEIEVWVFPLYYTVLV